MDYIASYYPFLSINIQTVLPNFFSECLLRIVLLFGVISMHLKCQPQAHYITVEEMLIEYKRPRKESYVPPWAMMMSVIFVPLLIFCLPLLLLRDYVETTQTLLGWSLSLLLNANCTEILKLTVLRPRPDFFYRCFPKGTVTVQLNCVGNVRDVIEGRKSFPSGHSSFAFCSLGFLSLWLSGKLRTAYRNLRIEIFCFLPLVLATVIGASRFCDNHHHWEDVLAGGLLGFASAYVCYKVYCKPVEHLSEY